MSVLHNSPQYSEMCTQISEATVKTYNLIDMEEAYKKNLRISIRPIEQTAYEILPREVYGALFFLCKGLYERQIVLGIPGYGVSDGIGLKANTTSGAVSFLWQF